VGQAVTLNFLILVWNIFVEKTIFNLIIPDCLQQIDEKWKLQQQNFDYSDICQLKEKEYISFVTLNKECVSFSNFPI
jgi:hypothetical protein